MTPAKSGIYLYKSAHGTIWVASGKDDSYSFECIFLLSYRNIPITPTSNPKIVALKNLKKQSTFLYELGPTVLLEKQRWGGRALQSLRHAQRCCLKTLYCKKGTDSDTSMSCRIESGFWALSHPLLPDIGTAPAIADAVFLFFCQEARIFQTMEQR